MSELLTFVHLGFRHIVDVGAADHILFLLALAAIYQPRDWRDALWVVSAFTVGHSITLALAVTGVLTLPSSLIEFLIPITILITGIENIVVRDRATALWGGRYRPIFAGVFGLVHGAGFANYLKSMFVDHLALPLFGFNVGIELGQVFVLGWAFLVLWGVDRMLASARLPIPSPSPLRLRVIAISALVTAVAASWAVQRSPFFTPW
jgi:HupE / UreJ protein